MKRKIMILTAVAAFGLAAGAQAKDASVAAPVYEIGLLTIHTQPEGAAIFVMEQGIWQALGYAPLTLQIPTSGGKVASYLYFRAIPTAAATT